MRRGVQAQTREQEILREVLAVACEGGGAEAGLTLSALRHFIWVQTLRGWKPTA